MVLLLLSDLDGSAGDPLRGVVRTLRHHKQQLLALAPHPAGFVPRPSGRAGALHDLLAWDADPGERPAARVLRAAGAPVATVGWDDAVPPVLGRLARLRT